MKKSWAVYVKAALLGLGVTVGCGVLILLVLGDIVENRTKQAQVQRNIEMIAKLNLLNLKPNAVVADVGAGEFGADTIPIALLTEGVKVIAIDNQQYAVDSLQDEVARFQLQNVEVLKGDAMDPPFPLAGVDGVIVSHAYHEVLDTPKMLEKLKRALKPGGRIVILDSMLAQKNGETREQQAAVHLINSEIVRRELSEAGLKEVEYRPLFTGLAGLGYETTWILAAELP